MVERLSKDGPWDSELWAQPRWLENRKRVGPRRYAAAGPCGYMAQVCSSVLHTHQQYMISCLGYHARSKTAVFRVIDVIRDAPSPRLSSPFSSFVRTLGIRLTSECVSQPILSSKLRAHYRDFSRFLHDYWIFQLFTPPLYIYPAT